MSTLLRWSVFQPFNLSKHYKDCNVKNSKNNKKLKQAAYLRANHKSTNALNSMIQPTKKLKHSSSSSSSSSSTSSNNNPITPPTPNWKDQAHALAFVYMFYFKAQGLGLGLGFTYRKFWCFNVSKCVDCLFKSSFSSSFWDLLVYPWDVSHT